MEEQLIDFETAKLAKEKGFDEKCFHIFSLFRGGIKEYGPENIKSNDGPYNQNHKGMYWKRGCNFDYHFLRPTQNFLQKWLRDKHRIYVDAFFNPDLINSTQVQIFSLVEESINDETAYKVWKLVWQKRFGLDDAKYQSNLKTYPNDERYNVQTYTYEQALEEGLLETLKLI